MLHYIDLKIIMKEENIILRIRDNGKAFNPMSAEDSDDQTGMDRIRQMITEIDYKNAVGMNDLMIVI